jgi:hypothetical protein
MRRADQPEPDLGLRVTGEQPMRGGDFVHVTLESACFDVYGDELAVILSAEPGPHFALIDVVAPPGKLFFTVPRIRGSAHDMILHHQAVFFYQAVARKLLYLVAALAGWLRRPG